MEEKKEQQQANCVSVGESSVRARMGCKACKHAWSKRAADLTQREQTPCEP